MRIDLHCHTEASHDCSSRFESVLSRCRQQSIAVQAVTDHNEIWGALELRATATAPGDPKIIVGEEVTSSEGEIIGLFLEEKIPAGLRPEEVVTQIRDQGGLVLLPHGFDPLKAHRLSPSARERIADDIDIVEVFNSRVSHPNRNSQASVWAAERDLPASAGTDAHIVSALGTAWVESPDRHIDDPEALLEALRAGVVTGTWTHPVAAYTYKLWDSGRRAAYRGWKRVRGETLALLAGD
ncbi:MAG: PHP-associated domain-containing protein [Trueperaceae bacterium]